jgi:hypothetical protein
MSTIASGVEIIRRCNGCDDRAAAIDQPFQKRAVGGSASIALFK